MIDNSTAIYIDKSKYNNIYKRLVSTISDSANKSDLPFKFAWQLFVWCAILGYKNRNKRVLNTRHSSFDWGQIKDPHQKRLYIMAIESVGSLDILKETSQLKENIEEFSNGGIEILEKNLSLDRAAYLNIESLIYEIQERV